MDQQNGFAAMHDDESLPDLPPPVTKAVVGRLSVTEERLAVRIEEREAGSVRVRTVTHKELKEVPVVLQSTSIHVDRVPVYRFVDAKFEPRQEGDTLIVPVFEYIPVTELRLMLKEEIHVKSIVTSHESVHQAEVQRQDVVIERRIGPDGEWIPETAVESFGSRRRKTV